MERMFVNGTNVPILSLLLITYRRPSYNPDSSTEMVMSITKTGSAGHQCATELWECKYLFVASKFSLSSLAMIPRKPRLDSPPAGQ